MLAISCKCVLNQHLHMHDVQSKATNRFRSGTADIFWSRKGRGCGNSCHAALRYAADVALFMRACHVCSVVGSCRTPAPLKVGRRTEKRAVYLLTPAAPARQSNVAANTGNRDSNRCLIPVPRHLPEGHPCAAGPARPLPARLDCGVRVTSRSLSGGCSQDQEQQLRLQCL